jgi:nucleoside permease NupC
MQFTLQVHLITSLISPSFLLNDLTNTHRKSPSQEHEQRSSHLQMISDTTLTHLSNGLGVAAMLLIVGYHFVAVNARRASA